MKVWKWIAGVAAALVAVSGTMATGQIVASDDASNYGSGWNDQSNGGTGFEPWVIVVNQDIPTSFAGVFVGNPEDAGITGFGTEAFGMYANPNTDPAPSVTADRDFSAPLAVGDVFSFQWAVNFDADTGNKGFDIYTGGAGITQLLNVNQGAFPGNIIVNGVNSGIAYGTGPMTWTFSMINATTLRVTSTARDGTPDVVFSTNVTVSGAADSFRWYASNMAAGNERQPYFNNLQIEEGEPPALQFLSGVATPGAVGEIEFVLERSETGGVDNDIILSSDNINAVFVPASVSFATDVNSLTFTGEVLSLIDGAATIIASNVASGAWAEFTVTPVAPVISITGPDSITEGGIATFVVTRSISVGDEFSVIILDPLVISADSPVSFPANENTALIKVEALGLGAAQISVQNDDAVSDAIFVEVVTAPAGIYDDASLYYNSWFDGDNSGSGFEAWLLEANNGGTFLGSAANQGTNSAALDVNDVSFGLFADGGGFSRASRAFASPLSAGDVFTFSIAHKWDNGNRGFNLYAGDSEVFNFNINDQGYSWTGGGSAPAIIWEGARENGAVLDVVVTRTGGGFNFAITSDQDPTLDASGSIASGAISGFQIYVAEAGGGGSDSDFFFNTFQVVSTPTLSLSGPAFITEDGIATYFLSRSAGVGDEVTLSSTDSGVVSVPLNVTFDVDANVLSFKANAPAVGSAEITASNVDATSDPLAIGVVAVAGLTDDASNYYGSWFDGDNAGNGFDPWILVEGGGGFFLGSSSDNGDRSPDIDSVGVAFGMYNQDVGETAAIRPLDEAAWDDGSVLSFQYSFRFDSGNRGVTLHDIGLAQIGYFSIEGSGYNLNGDAFPPTEWVDERENGEVLTFTITQNGDNLDWTVTGIHASSPNASGTILGQSLGAVRFYSVAGEGGGGNDVFFNNFAITESVEEEPAILNFAVNAALGARVNVDPSVAGTAYLLEYTTNLVANPVVWGLADEVTGTGGPITLQDLPLSSDPMRAYRMAIGNP